MPVSSHLLGDKELGVWDARENNILGQGLADFIKH